MHAFIFLARSWFSKKRRANQIAPLGLNWYKLLQPLLRPLPRPLLWRPHLGDSKLKVGIASQNTRILFQRQSAFDCVLPCPPPTNIVDEGRSQMASSMISFHQAKRTLKRNTNHFGNWSLGHLFPHFLRNAQHSRCVLCLKRIPYKSLSLNCLMLSRLDFLEWKYKVAVKNFGLEEVSLWIPRH